MNALAPKIALFTCSLSALVVGLIVGGGAYQPAPDGIPTAGPVLSWGLQVAMLIFTILGIRVSGLLLTGTFLVSDSEAVASISKPLSLTHISRIAALWALASAVVAALTLAVVLGIDAQTAFQPSVIFTYIWALAPSRSFLLTGLCALAIAGLPRVAHSLNTRALFSAISLAGIVVPLLNSHAPSLGDHSLAITASVLHGVSVTAWVGCLFAISAFVRASDVAVVNRFSSLAKLSVVVLTVSGVAAAYARMDSISDLWSSSYGQLVCVKIALLTIIVSLATRVRRRLAVKALIGRFLAAEFAFMAIAMGLGIALHATPMSRQVQQLPSAAEEVLGFAFPPAPTIGLLLMGWHTEWAMLLVALVSATLYFAGVISVRRKGIHWSTLRTLSFTWGIVVLIWATNSNVSRYAMVSFSAHMISHMALSMLAPIFLVLGAPITLALRALPSAHSEVRNVRAWSVALLHSRYSRFITHPLLVLSLFTVGLYALYFTSAFSALMSSHTGHLLMEFHFLATGFLFAFLVIGVDPSPREIPHWMRLILILVAISIHSFFAIAIMQSTSPIGNAWYSQVQPPWLQNPLKDTQDGGGFAWAMGDIPSLILMVLVAIQWSKSDAKLALRSDREADRNDDAQLKAYNKHLAEINRQQDS